MTSNPREHSPMANDVLAPPLVGSNTEVIQMDPSLLNDEFEKKEEMFDMSSIATTAATSLVTAVSVEDLSGLTYKQRKDKIGYSVDFPEEYQYSLRKKLRVPETPLKLTAEEAVHKFPQVVGHRGSVYEELENTRGGFIRAHDLGCDATEMDVFKIRRNSKSEEDDTVVVVFHGDLLPFCGIDAEITNFNYEDEIAGGKLSFRPGSEELPCPDEKIRKGEIPTLEDVLLDIKRKNESMPKGKKKMEVKMELKGPNCAEAVLELVESLGVTDFCSYSSFDLQQIKRVRELRPERDPNTGKYLYKTAALFEYIDVDGKIIVEQCEFDPIESVPNWSEGDVIERAHAVGASEIHLKYDTCFKPLMDRIHENGFGSMAWFRGPAGMKEDTSVRYKDVGNEDFAMYELLIQTGVRQLCVNRPSVLIALREKLFSGQGGKCAELLGAGRKLES